MTHFRTDTEIGQALKELRQDAGLNQQSLADSVGIDQPTLSRIESGQRATTAREVVLLAEALGAEPDQILRREDEATEMLLRADESDDESVRHCAEIFDACIHDYFGLKALLP